MVYYQDDKIKIRAMMETDIGSILKNYAEQKWHKPIEVIRDYFDGQQNGMRKVFVAEIDGDVAGYATMIPNASEGPFKNMDIPEFVDFNVFIKYQRKGIGNKIMDAAESSAKQTSDYVSLGVGLHSGYGSAQRMYVKRGYIPDGSGVWYRNKQLGQYEDCRNDDDLVVFMLKKL